MNVDKLKDVFIVFATIVIMVAVTVCVILNLVSKDECPGLEVPNSICCQGFKDSRQSSVVEKDKVVQVVLPFDVSLSPRWCVQYTNAGKGRLSNAWVEASLDGDGWTKLYWNTCDELEEGKTCISCYDSNAYRFVRGFVIAAEDTVIESVFNAVTCGG